MTKVSHSEPHRSDQHSSLTVRALALGALGVVFGDIGTSPLYAFRESLAGENPIGVTEANILGVLSLMFWSLIIVITVKYLIIVMRADNHGEGGILALAALITRGGRTGRALVMMGLFGTALLYGDGMITPAISVLSAVEGIEIAAPSVHTWVLPITVAILIGLFSIQRHGTSTVGKLFGPVMVVWFSTLAIVGTVHIVDTPSVLRALNPWLAVQFFIDNGGTGFLVLGSVFLVVTGGEALYADMGHFGRRPIQLGWFVAVLPALTLNYFGQGALLLDDATAIRNPFFLMAPSWAQWPLTVLATVATVIASQALISGAFSLSSQAANLGYLPRMRIIETSDELRGQVYVPTINWFLLAACVTLVVSFRSSSNLAAAYGVAVTMTMLITTMLIASVAIHRWKWSRAKALLILVPLGLIDLAFVVANLFKIPAGGWVPLAIGLIGFVGFTTWRKGRSLVAERIERRQLSVNDFVAGLADEDIARHPGTGVYLHRHPGLVPPALLANLRHNNSLHETVVFVSAITDDAPHVPLAQRERITHHDLGFHELEMHYGFADRPTLAEDLETLIIEDVSFDAQYTTYFLGRERIDIADRPGMAAWRDRLFIFMHRNASDPSIHFGLPREQSVDIGTHVGI